MSRNQLSPCAAHRQITDKSRCVVLLCKYSRASDIVPEHVGMDGEGSFASLPVRVTILGIDARGSVTLARQSALRSATISFISGRPTSGL